MLSDNFYCGKTYYVLNFKELMNQALKQQLLNLGLLPGRQFKVIRFAPFGGTIQIAIGRFSIMIRKNDLNQLDVQERPCDD